VHLTPPLLLTQVHLERTLRLSLLLGSAAVAHKAGVYVRTLQPFYKLSKDEVKKGLKVGSKEAKSEAEPWGTLAGWWHEAGRGLAKIEGCAFLTFFVVSSLLPR
jgi:hypothetical protein